MSRTPFHSIDYEKREKRKDPVVTVRITAAGKTIPSYVDTGCSCGLSLTKKQMLKLGLDLGTKINSDPEPAILADGSLVATDIYKVEVELAGEKKLVMVSVVDPDLKLEGEDGLEEEDEETLVGRDFLDHFDVLFSGLDKRITFSK